MRQLDLKCEPFAKQDRTTRHAVSRRVNKRLVELRRIPPPPASKDGRVLCKSPETLMPAPTNTSDGGNLIPEPSPVDVAATPIPAVNDGAGSARGVEPPPRLLDPPGRLLPRTVATAPIITPVMPTSSTAFTLVRSSATPSTTAVNAWASFSMAAARGEEPSPPVIKRIPAPNVALSSGELLQSDHHALHDGSVWDPNVPNTRYKEEWDAVVAAIEQAEDLDMRQRQPYINSRIFRSKMHRLCGKAQAGRDCGNPNACVTARRFHICPDFRYQDCLHGGEGIIHLGGYHSNPRCSQPRSLTPCVRPGCWQGDGMRYLHCLQTCFSFRNGEPCIKGGPPPNGTCNQGHDNADIRQALVDKYQRGS